MTGVTPIDRRDLTRMLNGILQGTKRDDIRVDVKYYVQFSFVGSAEDAGAVQTLVDPFSGFNRSSARALVQQAVERLDQEEQNADAQRAIKAPIAIPNDADLETDGPVPEAGAA